MGRHRLKVVRKMLYLKGNERMREREIGGRNDKRKGGGKGMTLVKEERGKERRK